MKNLVKKIRKCQICKDYLPNKPRPIVQISDQSKILIIGQAPGQKVQNSGIPWQDKSGDELRRWFEVNEKQFYDEKLFGILPMGFCYPGKGKSGDLPPRPECAPEWHHEVFAKLKDVKMTFLIGQYAQKYYLAKNAKKNLTETVKAYKEYLPDFFPLVHPSPRNRIWQRKNPWFENNIIPIIQEEIRSLI